jgi:hypothetical protein
MRAPFQDAQTPAADADDAVELGAGVVVTS